MKKVNLIVSILLFSVMCVYAQKPTKIEATLLNNAFSKVELVNSYGNSTINYASAPITDNKFSMEVNLPEDIYRLDFGNGSAFLVVLKPGENIRLLLDAENLQEVKSVSGSESMIKTKQMSSYAVRKKTVLDSINDALQKDPDKIYWSSFAQNINLFRQTNDDVDGYIAQAYDNVDSIIHVMDRYMPSGKISGKNMRICADDLNKWLKKLEINYSPFANYLENVVRYYNFSGQRVNDAAEYYEKLDSYMNHLNGRHDIAKNSFGSVIPTVKDLMSYRDSLAFNNHLDKKNLTSWLNKIYSIYNNFVQISKTRADYSMNISYDSQTANYLVAESQNKIKSLVGKYQQAFNAMDDYLTAKLKEDIRSCKDDISVLMFVDMFPREQNVALHNEVFSALYAKYPEHPIVKERWNYMNSPATKTSIGAFAPDLEFPNPDGKMLKLSDLRGKVVLIDFWASWCGPCRRENPNVTKIYNMYHDKGFEIFSVSLDSDAESWKRAIEQDKLIWPYHVSDLKKWRSAAAAIYGVSSIPSTFLLDKEGRIVQKNLRGSDLERAVKQLVEQ